MAASRRQAVAVVVGASALALVACDAILDLGQYHDVACAEGCDSGTKDSGTLPGPDAVADTAMMLESGADASADADADAGDVSLPDSEPVPTGHELWAHWPMPNPDAALGPESSTALPNPMTYDAGADGGAAVVYDVVTKLTWSRQAKSATSYDGAWAACSLGTGWRVPTRIELVSLIDFTRIPTLDTTTFLDAGGALTWTSSAVAGDGGPSGYYWVVDFGTGLTAQGGTPSQVLCVNGGTP
jgi:hypothetical protein